MIKVRPRWCVDRGDGIARGMDIVQAEEGQRCTEAD